MKAVMINDCAYVGETLAKYYPKEVITIHIKRTRGLWSKTFGLALKILKSQGDVYHAHYLLQDCYLASKFGKHPLIGHAHGSDLRVSLKHPIWGRIIEGNMKGCEKILVSTPDILGIAKKYREDAEYLPNPVDTNLFYPKDSPSGAKLNVLIASKCDWQVKGTDVAVRGLGLVGENMRVHLIRYGRDLKKTLVLAKSLGLQLNILPKVPHNQISRYYWQADVIVGPFGAGALGMVPLEAVACGRPAISYVSSRYKEYKKWPFKNIRTPEQIAKAVESLPSHLWKKEYKYLKANHDPEKVSKRLMKIYKNVVML